MIPALVRRGVPPLLACCAVALVAADEPAKQTIHEQVAQWVRDLGDDAYAKRENASKRLREAGRSAESDLKKAAASGDPEMRRRCQVILDDFRWGLYPDTPAKVAAMVRRYQKGDKGKVVMESFDEGKDGRPSPKSGLAKTRNPASKSASRRPCTCSTAGPSGLPKRNTTRPSRTWPGASS